ncbi:MAG: manganese catalase family protein [Eubacteriales bacterium]|nr:manganese catalase family protein [Eubacteriales bacterium]
MFNYEKRLQYPVRIHRTDAKMAKAIITQFGGPDGETGASLRYLSQRFAMPYREVMGILTDIGTEELNHIEMICTIVHQLTRNLTVEQIKEQGFADYYVDHTTGLWPQASSGVPFSAATFQSTGDPITDLMEDLAADGAGIRTTKTLCQTVCRPRSPLRTPPQKHLTWRCSQCFFGNLTSG